MFPDAGLERLLRLVESLSRKISDIDRIGFLDASVLGEVGGVGGVVESGS